MQDKRRSRDMETITETEYLHHGNPVIAPANKQMTDSQTETEQADDILSPPGGATTGVTVATGSDSEEEEEEEERGPFWGESMLKYFFSAVEWFRNLCPLVGL